MELSLDEAEAAFLKDVLSGFEAFGGASICATKAAGPLCYSITTVNSPTGQCWGGLTGAMRPNDGAFLQSPPSRSDASSATIHGRPPLPRSATFLQAARPPNLSTPQVPDPIGAQQLLQRQAAHDAAPGRLPSQRALHQQHSYPHSPLPSYRQEQSPLGAPHGTPPAPQPGPNGQPSCSLSDCSSGSGGGSAASTTTRRPHSLTPAWTLLAANPTQASSVIAAPPSGPALSTNHSSTSTSSEPESSSASLPAAGASPGNKRSAAASRQVSSGAALLPTSVWAREPEPPTALAPAPAATAATPSRRARALLQQIRTLESQLQHLLQSEAEAARSTVAAASEQARTASLRVAHLPGPIPDPCAPSVPAGCPQPLGPLHNGTEAPAGPFMGTTAGAAHRTPADAAASPVVEVHTPLVYALAEQLCRDYNSSGVALMEAGLDGAAQQQLDKALLLSGPDGPLEGRPNKQREMQILAHNNLACYHRRLQKPQLALEHLQRAASLETAAALAASDVGALQPAGRTNGSDGTGAGPAGGWGPTTATLLNLAACCGSLGQHRQALAYAEQAVASAAGELQISLPALEAALLQGLPQVQLWEVLPQLRRAESGATSQLAMAYYNRAVEQEHLLMWRPARESYRLAVDVAGRFTGRGSTLTLTMQQSAEAFKVRLRRLEKHGKLRNRVASSSHLGSEAASGSAPAATLSPASATPSAPSSSAATLTPRRPQPHQHLQVLRCASSMSSTRSAAAAPSACKARSAASPPPPPPPRRRLPVLLRTSSTPTEGCTAAGLAFVEGGSSGGGDGEALASTFGMRTVGATALVPSGLLGPCAPGPCIPAGSLPPRRCSLQGAASSEGSAALACGHAASGIGTRQPDVQGGALGHGPVSASFAVPVPYVVSDYGSRVGPEALLAGPGPPTAVAGPWVAEPEVQAAARQQQAGGGAPALWGRQASRRSGADASTASVARGSCSSRPMSEWDGGGERTNGGGSPRRSLALAAAEAAAATAELARMCEEEEEVSLGSGVSALGAVGEPEQQWQACLTTPTPPGGRCGAGVSSSSQPSLAPPLSVTVTEYSGSGGGDRRLQAKGQAELLRESASTNMLVPKRDGVAV